jgi:hypothetical protein
MPQYPGGHVPDFMWDGFVDPALPSGSDPQTICVNEPSASAVCNMHFDLIDPNNPSVTGMVCDASIFGCTLPPLAGVSWAGLSP